MRGVTLVKVIDTILCFHCGCEVANQNVALTIVGYPTNNKKTLAVSKFAVGLIPINQATVNMETLFARAIVAVEQCYKKTRNIKMYPTMGCAKIQLSEAQAWRNDNHLGQFTVACLFGSNEP